MGDRVWQIQKQLEELQSRCQGTSEVQTCSTYCSTFSRSNDCKSQLKDLSATFLFYSQAYVGPRVIPVAIT